MTTATATALVDAFATASGTGVWPGLSRATLASELKTRLGAPDSVDQSHTPFCGAASFTRALIIDKPDAYAQAAIDLFNAGEATIGNLKSKPGDTVRRSVPQKGTNQADWIMLARIRDSGNVVLSAGGFLGGSAAGVTVPGTLAGCSPPPASQPSSTVPTSHRQCWRRARRKSSLPIPTRRASITWCCSLTAT
jgi:hypothetical protein